MTNLLAPLHREEEITLRRVALSIGGERLAPARIRRLLYLGLIEQYRDLWRLTPLGRKRHALLARAPLGGGRSPSLEIERILEKAGERQASRLQRTGQPEGDVREPDQERGSGQSAGG